MNSIQSIGLNNNYSCKVNKSPSFKAIIVTEDGKRILSEMYSKIAKKVTNPSEEIMQKRAIELASQFDRISPLASNSKFYDLVFNKRGLCLKRCFEDMSKAISRHDSLEVVGNKIIKHSDREVIGAVEDESAARQLVNNLAPFDNTAAFIDLYKALEENAQITAERAMKTLNWFITGAK